MKPYGNIVTYESMLIGFTDAVSRFEDPAAMDDPVISYNALFEAIAWAVALDGRIGQHWVPDGKPLREGWRESLGHGATVMAGVRFARNRVHHQWSDAIAATPSAGAITWTWRPADELPVGRNPTGEDVYREHLECRPIIGCLTVLNGAFYTLQFLLEPHTARALHHELVA